MIKTIFSKIIVFLFNTLISKSFDNFKNKFEIINHLNKLRSEAHKNIDGQILYQNYWKEKISCIRCGSTRRFFNAKFFLKNTIFSLIP